MSYVYYNENPNGKSVGDCAIRAVSRALGQSWEKTYVGLALEGFVRGDLPNADSVWGAYLHRHGFRRHLLPEGRHEFYTVDDFAHDNPHGTFILSMPGRHVVAVVDGDYWDSWDSGREEPVYFWCRSE